MIVIEGKKYSCDTCIKGHRSSACKHTDRPLFEIQKKGRPVTQCSHCRELRKTKQVHVKCNCGDMRPGKGEPGTAPKKTQDPAFPNGVPENLAATVTLSLEHGSDSEHAANPKAGSCTCNHGGKCTCATARKSKRSTGPEPPLDPSTAVKSSAGHEYRRVLPKPHQNTSPVPPSRPGPIHPSSTGSGKQKSLYSPYERAYDANHPHHTPPSDHSESDPPPFLEVGPNPTSRAPGNQGSLDWGAYPTIPVRSLCSCGDSCSCPGCFEHRGPSALQAYQGASGSPACANPRFCTSCVECAVVLGHPDQQAVAPGSFDTRASSFMDEWLRQLVEGMPTLPADGTTLHEATLHSDPPVPNHSTRSPPGISSCCEGNCGCQPGFCVCVGGCFGDCHGAWGGEGDAAAMSIDPAGSTPHIGLDSGWEIPAGDRSWILTEPGISSDGSSDGEVAPGVDSVGDFNWGV